MKKFLPFLILVFLQLLNKSVIAQEFAPIGATWYYTQYTLSPNLYYVKKECIGNTTINNKVCSIIYGGTAMCGDDNNYEYLYSDSNKVFRYDAISNQFYLLYDFNANAGDTWNTFHRLSGNGSLAFITIRVDSVSDTLINNHNLKILNISSLDSNGEASYIGFAGKIIERIGSDFYMFLQVQFCDPVTGELRCYNDSIINFNLNFYLSCDYIYTGIQGSSENNLEIFPNPFVDVININNIKASNYSIKILNTSLQTVFISKENSKNISINLSYIAKGVYLCLLSNEQGYFKIFKIAKI